MTVPTAIVHPEHLDAIVTTVWDSLFGEPVYTASVAEVTDAPRDTPAVQAVLRITGEWAGTVALTVPAPFAAAATRDLFTLPEHEDPSPAEITDATGEIANIIAGNVKALLPEPSTLGLPVVTLLPDVPALPSPAHHGVPDPEQGVSGYYVARRHVLHLHVTPDPATADPSTGTDPVEGPPA